jgi:retron-type reverse transcriptase
VLPAPNPKTAWTEQQYARSVGTVTDRVVQASLKLVLEPILEADFHSRSYGFRPGRRVHDAIAETRHLTSWTYEWVVEGDIKACFDEISHSALLARLRGRVGDNRVLALVKAFLKAGILGEDGRLRDSDTGAPQGSIFTPPTQWATHPMVTLRVGVFGVGADGVLPDGDAVLDGDFLGSDEDVLDEQA